jgi:hypothetical protein
LGEVIYVDFKRKCRVEKTWLDEEEAKFMAAMRDLDTPTADEYYGSTPSDSEPQ